MGTRSLTIVKDENNRDLITMYRQMDGYPTGHGQELADFLRGMVIVNGIQNHGMGKQANGMNCLAAQIVAHFKTEIGGIYLDPPRTKKNEDYGEEYIYIVTGYGEDKGVNGSVSRPKKHPLFDGPVEKFNGEAIEALEND